MSTKIHKSPLCWAFITKPNDKGEKLGKDSLFTARASNTVKSWVRAIGIETLSPLKVAWRSHMENRTRSLVHILQLSRTLKSLLFTTYLKQPSLCPCACGLTQSRQRTEGVLRSKIFYGLNCHFRGFQNTYATLPRPTKMMPLCLLCMSAKVKTLWAHIWTTTEERDSSQLQSNNPRVIVGDWCWILMQHMNHWWKAQFSLFHKKSWWLVLEPTEHHQTEKCITRKDSLCVDKDA